MLQIVCLIFIISITKTFKMEEISSTAANAPPKFLDAPVHVFFSAAQNANFGGISTNASTNSELSADDSEELRLGFIRKVYAILTVEIVITASIIGVVLLYEPAKYNIMNPYLQWACYCVLFTVLFIFNCMPATHRVPILNLALLMLYTIDISIILIAGIMYYFEPNALLIATGLTVAMFIGLTMFAFQTKCDSTKLSGSIYLIITIFVVLLIVKLCLQSNIFTLIFSSLGVLIFSLCLVHDTQLLQAGKHKVSFMLEEYTLAAYSLYTSIIIICVLLTQLIWIAIHFYI